MHQSISCATAVRRILGPGPLDAEASCNFFDVAVDDWPFRRNIEALYTNGWIAVKTGLPRPIREARILHELGHHLMHGKKAGQMFWFHRDSQMLSKVEHQAEMFMYFVSIPSSEWKRMMRDRLEMDEIAQRYCRTLEWVRERKRLEDALVGK